MSPRSPAPGALVDNKYRLAERIGGGGMGDVFRAESLGAMPRQVAIKFLHPELALSSDLSQRFFQEAQAVNRIRHPNVVEVIEVGVGDLGPYIVMEYLEGESAGAALSRVTRFDVEAAVAAVLPLLEALDAAHRAGIIHRDLKPENVFIAVDPSRGTPVVRLLDFGIAKVLDSSEPSPRTRTGVVFGTPDYLSPEQATGDAVLDGRSDLFSVGVLLYELLTGTRPFKAPTAVATAFKVVHVEAPSLASAGVYVDARLEAVMARLLQKEPERRFPTAHDVIRELERVVPDPARRSAALARVLASGRRLSPTHASLVDSDRTSVAPRESSAPAWRRALPGPAQVVGPIVARTSPPAGRISDPAPSRPNNLTAHEPPSAGRMPIPPPPPSFGSGPSSFGSGPSSFGGGSPSFGGGRDFGGGLGPPSSSDPRAARPLGLDPTRQTRASAPDVASSPSSASTRPSAPTINISIRPFPARFAGLYQVRGPVLRSVDKVVLDLFGPETRAEIVEQMPERFAAELRNDSINALVGYDLESLDAYMEIATSLAVRDPARWKELGRLAVDGELANVVRHLLRPTPDLAGLLRRSIAVWAKLFSFGMWRVTPQANGKVALQLTELDPVGAPLRQWMVGVAEQTARRAVRADVRAVILSGDQGFAAELVCELG